MTLVLSNIPAAPLAVTHLNSSRVGKSLCCKCDKVEITLQKSDLELLRGDPRVDLTFMPLESNCGKPREILIRL